MPYKDREKQRAAEKRYYENNRKARIKSAGERNKRVLAERRALLEPFSCASCGNTDPTVIEWHHIDPSEKEKDVYKCGSEEKFWDEILKCVPLCGNCHIKIHKNLLCLLPQSL